MEHRATSELTRKEREWLERRGEIIAAAASLFAESGYSGTTMQAIAERADFSVGYLYRHFESKQAIVEAIIDRELEQYEKIVEQVLTQDLSPLLAYRRIMEELSSYVAQRRALVRVMARETLLRRLPERNKRLQKFRGLTVELMRRAHAAGEIPLVDFTLLGAVLEGVSDNLMLDLTTSDDPQALKQLPDIIFEYVIEPLTRRTPGDGPRKEGNDAQHHRN